MADKVKIFEVNIDYEQAINNGKKFREEIDKLKTQSKEQKKSLEEMAKGGDTSSTAFLELSKKLERTSSNLRINQKEYNNSKGIVDNYNKTVDKQFGIITKTDGSIKGLATALRNNKKVYSELTAEQRASEQVGGKLIKTISKQDSEYKELQKSIGNNQVEVGNYSNAIKEALGSNTSFSGGLSQMAQRIPVVGGALSKMITGLTGFKVAQQGSTVATKGASTGLKAFRVALISTGIGAIVVVLGTLIGAFLSTQKGISKVNKYLIPLKAGLSAVWGYVQDLGTTMVSAFTDPQVAISDLWEFIKTNLLNRVTGLVDTFKYLGLAIFDALSFDFEGVAENSKKLGNAILQTGTGIENLGKKLVKTGEEVGEVFSGGTESGGKVAKLTKEIEEREANIALIRAKSLAYIKEQNKIGEDTTKSIQERETALANAVKERLKLEGEEQKLIELRLERKKKENSLNDTSREDLKEQNEIEAELYSKRAESLELQTTLQNRINALRKSGETERLKAIEQEKKLVLEKINEQDQILQNELKNKDITLAQAQEVADRRLDIYRELKINEVITESEFHAKQEEINAQNLEIKKEKEAEEKALKTEAEQIDYENRIALEDERYQIDYDRQLAQLERQKQAELKKAELVGANKDLINQKFANQEVKINELKEQAKLQATMGVVGNIKGLLKENSLAFKAISIAEATISTYKSAVNAIEAGFKIDPTGILGGINAGISIASGLANVSKISSTKFAEGGVLQGNSHAKGGIPFSIGGALGFEAEGGEFLINKYSTAKNLPLIKEINKPNSNVDFSNIGEKVKEGAYLGTYEGLQQTKVVTNVSDISEIQTQIKEVETYANL